MEERFTEGIVGKNLDKKRRGQKTSWQWDPSEWRK